ncbi:hypothetical protein [Cesiribacter sp. SM1]|uniref:hypothetical protein n=1 Tax=Cesiribacter sp. SM1 TaxID=2861196 RepID=UPI001CD540C9|nr:hypothetical protein [Cesiribacter sp. SM1]
MTGGVGFSRQGHDSFRHNRKLSHIRPSMKDNPYTNVKDVDAGRDASVSKEAAQWRDSMRQKQKKLRILIFGLLLPAILLLATLAAGI